MARENIFSIFFHKKDNLKNWITTRGYFRDIMVSCESKEIDFLVPPPTAARCYSLVADCLYHTGKGLRSY